jgi:hypothetical protein
LEQDLKQIRNLFSKIIHESSADDHRVTKREAELLLASIREMSDMRVSIIKRMDLIYYITITLGFVLICVFAFYVIKIYTRRRE